ncbi:MAG: hypothetical protein Tsb0020_23890 [Haliangiales bacterium]
MKQYTRWPLLLLAGLATGCLSPDAEFTDAPDAPPPPPVSASASAGAITSVATPLRDACSFETPAENSISIDVGRVVGNLDALRSNNAIDEFAYIDAMVYGGDADTVILFNDRKYTGEVISRSRSWTEMRFTVPVHAVHFPADPGPDRVAKLATNKLSLASTRSDKSACDSFAWASIIIERAPLPVVLAHGLLDSPASFNEFWRPSLESMGILVAQDLDLGPDDSIVNNSGKLKTAVTKACERYGSRQVNIVGHSKGGIDARHYVANSKLVARLIQIGAPNAGTKIADHVFLSTLLLSLYFGENLFNSMPTGPGSLELTTSAMTGYNLTASHNTNTKYISLAGDHRPTFFCFFDPSPFHCFIEKLLIRLVGRGDTMVSIASAHALPYADHLLYSSGADRQAVHDPLIRSQDVFDMLIGSLTSSTLSFSTSALSPAASEADFTRLAEEEEVPTARTESVGGVLEPGDILEYAIPVDEAQGVTFEVMHLEPGLDLALISPNGEFYDPERAREDPELEYGEGEILGGLLTSFKVPNREPGTWLVMVIGERLDKPAAHVVHAVLEDPELRFEYKNPEPLGNVGKPLELEIAFNRELEDVRVTAHVLAPTDGQELPPSAQRPVELELRDEGQENDREPRDGVFSGVFFETEKPGLYQVAFTTRGVTPAGSEFTREDFAVITVLE